MTQLETITGDLRAVAELEEGTFQDFDELSRDQVASPRLLHRAFRVSTFPLYTARGGNPALALARHTKEHPNNLVLRHLFDEENSSYNQLINKGNFRPDSGEAQAVLEAADTLQVKLRDLRLSYEDKDDSKVYCFLAIRTKDGFVKDGDNYERPRDIEQAVIRRVGYTEEFMAMLQRKCPYNDETRLYLLAPDYVVAEAGEQFIGRAAWRNDFSCNASSYAYDCNANYRSGLRGVRLVVAP